MTENFGKSAADPSLDKVDVVRLRRSAHRAIGWIAILLPLLYAYLSFKNAPVKDLIKSLSNASAAEILWKLTLFVYFLLWVWGTKTDAEDQELVYRFVPDRGRFSTSYIGVVAGIFVLAAILLASPNFELFVVALAVFFIFNIFSWQFLVRKIVGPSLSSSRIASINSGDLIGTEELEVIQRYLCGKWQWYRFALGGVVILGLAAIAYIKNNELNIIDALEPFSWDLVQALGMLVFVLVMEIWIWSERFRAKLSLEFLEDFRDRYSLLPKQSA
jgi:hypothetical protein